MKSYIRVSTAEKKTRREAVNTLRLLLDNHVPRKMAFHQVTKQLKSMHLPHSKRTLYYWCAEFGIKTN